MEVFQTFLLTLTLGIEAEDPHGAGRSEYKNPKLEVL